MVEENNYDNTIDQVDKILEREEEFKTAVKGSQAESLSVKFFNSLKSLREAFEKGDIQQVHTQFKVIGPLGPEIESVLIILRNQAKYGVKDNNKIPNT